MANSLLFEKVQFSLYVGVVIRGKDRRCIKSTFDISEKTMERKGDWKIYGAISSIMLNRLYGVQV